jgi:DNA helicase-2/ATP-dependent DNA helicase PcrA
MPWFEGLVVGSQTYLIASSPNDRVRVVAGPGTGKSFAMKRRVARLLEEGIAADRILPVTFTRVAAEDLHRELIGMGTPGCEHLNGVTLHSLSLRMLMRNHVLAATGRVARPLNDFELQPLLCDLMGAHGGKRETKKKKQAYEAAWARLQHEEPGFVIDPADAAFATDVVEWLQFHRAMLIGEVIPQLYQYLRSNPAAAERTEFLHIVVDEYQDLNRAEQGVIQLLSDDSHVCIVGDDDQSIYSFKHAHPEGIREWLAANAGAADLNLGECRRCPIRVVAMANSLIQHNPGRTPRALVPCNANGQGDVRIIQYQTLDAEVSGVANLIGQLVLTGTLPGDILVLAQRSAIGTPIYDTLVGLGVPVRSHYAESELDDTEAQRRFALFKLFVDRTDRVALRWLVGLTGNNWHAAGYRRVRQHCEMHGVTPWNVLAQLSQGQLHIPHTAALVAAFTGIVAELEQLEGLPDLKTVVDNLFPDGNDSVRDIRALALLALLEAGEDRSVLLSELVKAITQPEIPTEIAEVRIMSLHKSKGLSAPVTIIAGCVEGLLPKQPDQGTPAAGAAAAIQEQRRLFFVGITRVKASPAAGKPGRLILTYSQQMPMAAALGAGIAPAGNAYGVSLLHASRFIQELGPHAPAPIAG